MSDPAIEVVHVPAKRRYELHEGTTVVGAAHYRRRSDQVVFTHTTVSDAYAGQGLGARLADVALTDVRDAGLRIVPECPYIAAYLRRHHEFDDVVDWPSPGETGPTGRPGR
ncbi:GNAT family N-acetyltransferase [Cellulomonas aerilata]|uniref:N-acetyltransferase n=1 Tax=Cellulomonas aerilata TaxID=515326 RepID=A0A512D9C8_9CELL|nr:GNAT family N-acetyltransferase [Cellulomonas aerilata]GEO33092.1 N-acetyltransferase [Cellulomonas aerilata]